MSVQISPNLPANVVEIGNEITQSKINEINSGTIATQSYVGLQILNVQTWVQNQGYITTPGISEAPTDGQQYVRQNSGWSVVSGGGGSWNGGTVTNAITVQGASIAVEDAYNSSNIGTSSISVHTDGYGVVYLQQGGIQFGDGTFQSSASAYNSAKSIANICAACFSNNGTNFVFVDYVALCVAQSGKFTSGSSHLVGLGYAGSAPSYVFSLTTLTPGIVDTGITYTTVSGQSVCYSSDAGSSWTYSDLTI